MSGRHHLEIISPSGEVNFYDLDPARGITNIGSHPENDIVIDTPGVAAFHAVLDHRDRPYQLMLLSDDSGTSLRGEQLAPNVATEVHTWDSIQLDGHTIMLLEDDGAAPQPASSASAPGTPASTPTATPTEPAETPEDAPDDVAWTPPSTVYESRPPDVTDDVIIVETEEREWTVDVENTITFDVTITNGGALVATFEPSIEGLDPNWVTISEPQVNLYEGDSTTISISISPPRSPHSYAADHHFAVIVTSSTHPGRQGQIGATLTVTPYHEFGVGDISPKQQTVSWRNSTGEITFPLHNRSNAQSTFQLSGEDDERACRFEFSLPGEEATLVRQAELQLAPDERVNVPVEITPTKRRLIGLRKHDHNFTVTASMLDGQTTPRTVMGQLKSKPLIGPLLIALMTLTLAVLVVLIFRPQIDDFKVNEMLVAAVDADNSATLRWRASRFAGLRIEPNVGSVDGPAGAATVIPDQNQDYTLIAENWLTGINRDWFSDQEQVRVIVTPVPPTVRVFRATQESLVTGQSATIFWDVVDAEQVELASSEETLSTEPNGQQEVSPSETTTYQLTAGNKFDQQTRRITIRVNEPTPTPVPKPKINRFAVNPPEITEGERVTVEWDAEDAERVVVQQCGIEEGPPSASITCALGETTELELVAFNGDQSTGVSQSVIVNPAPTATPEPVAPVIDLFRLTPEEIPYGDEATLNWSVTGETTSIEISGPPDFGINGVYPVLQSTGSITVTAEETALFILRAFNGDLKTEAPAELSIIPSTPTPTPTGTPTPAPTAVPDANIVFFRAESAGGPNDKVTQTDDNKYEVEAGSTVRFTWVVQRAEKVSLSGFGDQPFEGELETVVTQSGTYQLTAQNSEGNEVNAFIQIEVQPPPEPPPPHNVDGETLDNEKNRITWQYDSQRYDIEGFRVYRSEDLSGGNFSMVAGEDDGLSPGIRTWTDEDGPSCGKAYYVVAVYIDIISEEKRETAPSKNVWASLPCQD